MADNTTFLPEINVEPLGDTMLNFLIDRDQEEPFIDFKETLSISKDAPFEKIAKDIFAFSNYGGGFLIIGFRERKIPIDESKDVPEVEKRRFLPVGLSDEFSIDPANLQTKFNSYSSTPIRLDYREFHREFGGIDHKFAAIYIPASSLILRPTKDGKYIDERGKSKIAFRADTILFRRGTQSIIASDEEVAFIKRRAEKEGYKLSILDGQPDQIQETLYSNLFEITKMPTNVWVGSLKSNYYEERRKLNVPPSLIYILWNGKIVTFTDISKAENPLWPIIEPSSIHSEEVSKWLDDEVRQDVIIWLLNKELGFLARKVGLLPEEKNQKFYYGCDGEYRKETWVPRYRASSTLTVAQRMWANQLGCFIWWHLAVTARFKYIGQRLFLRLNPTLMLTDDGRNAIFGPRQGTVITRLTYNRYNDSYLNNLLFWASRFAEGQDKFTMAEGKLAISAKPFEAKINFGILHDRPTAEPIQEMPEIEIIEGE